MFDRLNASLAATAIAAVMLFAPAASAVPSTAAECGLVVHFNTIPQPGMPVPPTSMQQGACTAGPLADIPPTLSIDETWSANILLPNFIDQLPLKEIWIQVMTETSPDLFAISVAGFDTEIDNGNTPIPGEPHGISAMQGGFIAHFWIMPNPDFEVIALRPMPDQLACEQNCVPPFSAIWIATVSRDIPEPGALALFGLGLAGLGMLRRRRMTA
jgi:hypothetical protein